MKKTENYYEDPYSSKIKCPLHIHIKKNDSEKLIRKNKNGNE